MNTLILCRLKMHHIDPLYETVLLLYIIVNYDNLVMGTACVVAVAASTYIILVYFVAYFIFIKTLSQFTSRSFKMLREQPVCCYIEVLYIVLKRLMLGTVTLPNYLADF